MWFLWRLAPGSAFYNVPIAVRFKGALRVDALRRALQEVVRRHAILRTTYREGADGLPVQVVHPPSDIELLEVDAEQAQAEYERPFDLLRGPVLRACLLRTPPPSGGATLLLTLHHIACDGWGINVLTSELRALYRAYAHGLASPLAEPDCQYHDFAREQSASLDGDRLRP